jgi:hypothetical protein
LPAAGAVRAALEPLLDQMRTVGDPHERENAAEMNRLLQRLPSALTNISELLEIERNHQRSWSGPRCAAVFDKLVKNRTKRVSRFILSAMPRSFSL